MKLITLDNLNHFKEKLEKLNATNTFNLIYPVGVTYTQYPQQASPMDLWGTFSTWEVIDYDGAFFRAAGGNANAFIEESGVLTKQAGQNLAHSHEINGSVSISAHCHGQRIGGKDDNPEVSYPQLGTENRYTGKPLTAGYPASNARWKDGREQVFTDPATPSATLNASIITQGGNECRPDNFTIRIWKRTA